MQITGLLRIVGFGLINAALVYGGPPVGPGYLARVGPTPLRFKVEVHGNPAVLLPRLKLSDDDDITAATATEQKYALTAQAEGIRSTEEDPHDLPGDLALSPGEMRNSSAEATQPAQASGESIIAPQMLLRYFNRSTNETTVISVPVEFTPPGAPTVKSSTATYLSPP